MTGTKAKIAGLGLLACLGVVLLTYRPATAPAGVDEAAAASGPEAAAAPNPGRGQVAPGPPARELDEAQVLRWLEDHPESAGRIIKQLQASTSGKGLQFEELPPMTVPHVSAGVVAWKDRLYVWSGYSTEGQPHYDRTTALEIFDGEKNAWQKGADLPAGRSSMGCFALDGKIYSIGGEGSPSG